MESLPPEPNLNLFPSTADLILTPEELEYIMKLAAPRPPPVADVPSHPPPPDPAPGFDMGPLTAFERSLKVAWNDKVGRYNIPD
jgi:hypothetical protein